jgi:hypothetical protein
MRPRQGICSRAEGGAASIQLKPEIPAALQRGGERGAWDTKFCAQKMAQYKHSVINFLFPTMPWVCFISPGMNVKLFKTWMSSVSNKTD